jgi:hypothetical protein
MLVKRIKLHPMARAGLQEIQAAGVDITPDVVLTVQAAAEAIRKTPLRSVAELVDWPVLAGGVALYPLSFGAVAWLMGLPPAMRNDVCVIGYACAHSFRLKLLRAVRWTVPAWVAVRAWSLGVRCSRAALAAAVDEALGCEEYVEVKDTVARRRDPESADWGAVVRALCTKYPGTTGAYWTWQVSRDYCYAMLQQVNEELPDGHKVTDYEIEANVQFRAVIEHLKGGGSLDG